MKTQETLKIFMKAQNIQNTPIYLKSLNIKMTQSSSFNFPILVFTPIEFFPHSHSSMCHNFSIGST